MITIDEFRKLDLRVGTIREAHVVAHSEKLLKLTVDIGDEPRAIVGGLAQSYSPRDLQGQQVIVVANLAPAIIYGIESQGMLLGVNCAETRDIALLTVNRPVSNGSRVA